MSKVVAIIPARGGSVRVPKKNIKPLNGKPLIAYAINASKKSQYVDRIIVSTDCDEIKRAALEWGAEVPFKRPADISEDVPTEDVVIHAVKWLNENDNYCPDIVVCLEPPSPFRKTEHLDKCIQRLIEDKTIDSAITINSIRGNRPEWYVRFKDGKITPYTDYFTSRGKAILQFPASQIFEPLHQPNGVVFSCRASTLSDFNSMVGTSCAGIEIEHEDTFDLDFPDDFELCEAIMKQRNYSI